MRRFFMAATAVLILTSCGSVAAPAGKQAPPLAGDPRLLLTSGGGGGAQQILVWDVQRHTTVETLPFGAVSPDRRVLYAVVAGSPQHLDAVDIASGKRLARTAIPDGFGFPQGVFAGNIPAALSPNGAWIALQSFDQADQNTVTRTRYLIIDSAFHTSPRTVNLTGDWDFDALSNDGQRLYLLQRMPQSSAGAYRVRLYDLGAGALWPQTIVDKRLWGDTMSGTRLVAVPAADQTWLFSLYAFGPTGPFIHALSLDRTTPLAWCVDLPSTANGGGELDLLWTLLRSQDGQHLYAVNAGEGVAAEISLAGESPPVVSRIGKFAVQRTSSSSFLGLVVNAEAKRFLVGGAVLSTDGRTVYALGDNGIYAIDTASLKVAHEYLTDVPFDSVVLTADGHTLFASSSQQNKIFRIDLGSGITDVITGAIEVNSLLAVASP